MDYFCDIYDKIIGTIGLIATFGFFIALFCPVMPTVERTKGAFD